MRHHSRAWLITRWAVRQVTMFVLAAIIITALFLIIEALYALTH